MSNESDIAQKRGLQEQGAEDVEENHESKRLKLDTQSSLDHQDGEASQGGIESGLNQGPDAPREPDAQTEDTCIEKDEKEVEENEKSAEPSKDLKSEELSEFIESKESLQTCSEEREKEVTNETESEIDQINLKENDPKLNVPNANDVSEVKQDNCFEMEVKKENESEKSDVEKDAGGSEPSPNATESSEKNTDNGDDEKSNSSEKENAVSKCDSISTDVIMLSDEEEEARRVNGKTDHDVLKKIKELQNQLRNEEATLVLLKKLRQSQTTAVPDTVAPAPAPKAPAQHAPQQAASHMRPQAGGPPPLVRGASNQSISSKGSHSMARGHQLNQQPRSQQGPPPLVMTPRAGHNGQLQVPQAQQHSSSRSNVSHSVGRGNVSSRSQQQPPAPKAPPAPPVQDTQTPAQRQAAAKQALRKQLEKTLLQIPPPKPPPPEMNFIPSLACPDFVLLLGLEEVVNHMIDFQLIARGQKNPDERFVCTPFTCVQCGSDFTPVWKREKPGSKNVICEHCVTSNQKKALKQEHTNRLKSAFVKALQQEQEIERMQAVPSPQPTPREPRETREREHSVSANAMSAASAAAAAANAAAAAAAVANFRPSAEQLRQRHSFLQQAQQAQLRAGHPLGLQAFSNHFPYNLPFANQQELQRQYLLDMIPRGNMAWKQ